MEQPTLELPQAPIQDVNQIPSPPKKKLVSKVLFLLLILVVIGAAAFTYLYTQTYFQLNSQLDEITHVNSKPSPTPDPTAHWKTFTNTAYGYTFMYPEAWEVHHIQKDIVEAVTTPNGGLSVQIRDEMGNISLDDFVKKEFVSQLQLVKITSNVSTTLDGEHAYKIKMETEEVHKTLSDTSIVTKHNGHIYLLLFTEDAQNEMDEILSTFKFTHSDAK